THRLAADADRATAAPAMGTAPGCRTALFLRGSPAPLDHRQRNKPEGSPLLSQTLAATTIHHVHRLQRPGCVEAFSFVNTHQQKAKPFSRIENATIDIGSGNSKPIWGLYLLYIPPLRGLESPVRRPHAASSQAFLLLLPECVQVIANQGSPFWCAIR